MRVEDHIRRWYRSCVEGAVTGLAYAGTLVALSALAVGTFRPGELASPYWGRITWLRTDTFGLTCFILAALGFTYSEFLRLSRITRHRSDAPTPEAEPLALLTLATARVLTVASSALVVYLSANDLTQPETLGLPVTHLLSWPTESTVRAAALVVTACAVAVARTQRITMGIHGRG
jgi:hypothetical protein